MRRCARLRFTVIAALLGIALVLGSCTTPSEEGDGGFLGASFTIPGPLQYAAGKVDFEPSAFGGTIDFSMQGSAVALASATVTSGEFSVQINAPGAAETSPWNTVLPSSGTLTVSDATAEGYVINTVTFHETDPDKNDLGVFCANFALTTLVYFAYTDKDVHVTATGSYTGPLGAATMDMDFSLKVGWNRIVMTRTGTSGSYADTYRIGEAPADVHWAYGWS